MYPRNDLEDLAVKGVGASEVGEVLAGVLGVAAGFFSCARVAAAFERSAFT